MSILSKRYSLALFEIAKESNQIDNYYQEILLIKNLLEENKKFIDLLKNPKLSSQEKQDLISNTFKNVSQNILNLFFVLLNKNRQKEIYDILKDFIELYNEYKGILIAEVSSVLELNSQQISNIKNNLSKKFGKEIQIKSLIDKSLIGGIVNLIYINYILTNINIIKEHFSYSYYIII